MTRWRLASLTTTAGLLLLLVGLLAWFNMRVPHEGFRRAVFFRNAQEVRQIVDSDPAAIEQVEQQAGNQQPLFAGINLLVLLESHFPNQNEQFAELNRLKFTPLQISAFHDDVEIADFLLTRGAKPNATSAGNFTALHIAVMRGSTNVMRLLLSRGAEVNAMNTHGFTPLHIAVLAGRPDMAELLLLSGADSYARDREGQTPLDRATVFQKRRILEFMSHLKITNSSDLFKAPNRQSHSREAGHSGQD
jgi:ankyrin repeat protein